MKIELYLRTITQEYSDKRVKENLNKNRDCDKTRDNWQYEAWPTDWHGEWGGQNWNYQAKLLTKNLESRSRISDLLVREENFGALIFDPVNTSVFKVDKEACMVIEYLQKGITRDEIRKIGDFDSAEIEDFISRLKKYKIW